MFALGKFFVQTPKDLNDTQCGRSDGIGEVTTGWRNGTDDRDRALTFWATLTFDATGALVEGSQTGTQISGITAEFLNI